MLRQTEAYQLNPVTRCMSKDHMLNKWYCVAKTTEVTITSGLPGGNRNNNGTFNNIGKNGNWWSSTENNTNNAWKQNFNNGNLNNNNKNNNNYVRAVRGFKQNNKRLKFSSSAFI
jgi:uncharacterized protein (TIGR02145 family)